VRRLLPSVVRLFVVAAVVMIVAPGAQAATTSGPSVVLARSEVSVGDRIKLLIAGFQSPFVTISTCGNEARRGSIDCNIIAGQGLRLDPDGGSRDEIIIAEPPAKCPCVIRVSNQTNDEIAVAPITITGHPLAPVVDPPLPTDAVAVSLKVHSASSGVIDAVRSAMGGGARYSLALKVTNKTTVPLRNVALFGSVGRGEADELTTLDIPAPGQILPGQSWEGQVYARVPSPTFGHFNFRVSATGAGPTVSASATLKHSTPLLFALIAVLVLEGFYLTYRWLTRRRLQRASAESDAVGDDDVAAEDGVAHLPA
jgi:hypothetical protein